MRALLYLATIVAANIITAKFVPLTLGIFIIPWGSFLIGVTFILRDLTQNQIGRKKTYLVILLALVLSGISSYLLGDGLTIVTASLIAFLISETTDTEIYTRLKLKMEYRVLYSGLVGGLLDSTVFVVIGLSPIGAGFLTWNQVFTAIVGQVIIKSIMQFIGVLAIKTIGGKNK
ncbi:VUT family protein [Neobacillus niacini]|uniref:VUT family protein n=1 Tax=Neobacillus niacini TaxID=86668 RepID=UPI002FFFB14B